MDRYLSTYVKRKKKTRAFRSDYVIIYVLNGDFADDEEHEITFVGHGRTVVDYATVNGKAYYDI